VLTIVRKGETKPLVVTLTREVIKVQSVKSKLVEPGYGYVRVTQFQEDTGENLVKHLEKLWKQGPMKGLVLDLRNDPGGLLQRRGRRLGRVPAAEGAGGTTDGRTEDAKRKYSPARRTTCAARATTS
jgi:carboxyl-terminal processing protease